MAEEKKFNESLPKPVSLKATEKIIDQMNNSICRLQIDNKKGNGFFTKIPYKNNLLPVLITNNHIINIDDILNHKNISIYINNDKKIKTLKLDINRKKYTNEELDITIIEIIENEDKLNNKYLELDDEIINYFQLNKEENINYLNYIDINESIYLLNYQKDKDIFVSYGKIKYLNKTELYYQCNIMEGSLGGPILLTNNQKLIGIHNQNPKKYKYNKGSQLIYSIKEFSNIKKNSLLINKERNLLNNYIIGTFDIKEDNQNIRIINSCSDYFSIKENCEIRINNKIIPFSYFYTFHKKGKYQIIYTFKINITKTDSLFSDCEFLTKIDLSDFDTSKVTNMSCMFYKCYSLESIDLYGFNTDIVTSLSCMFFSCYSLKKLNLLEFNTSNVKYMRGMFCGCSSLTSLDLSNFNTNNVIDMSFMFCGCENLISLNLSKFNTNNVEDMSYMFCECFLITSLDLSNFNIDNVSNMYYMFKDCIYLKNINNDAIDLEDLISTYNSIDELELEYL